MARATSNTMNRLLALALLLAGCATSRYSAPEPCRICDASSVPRHDAPIRLFNPDIPTPCGRPHPGWSPALRERMARERQWASNPTLTPMDYEATRAGAPFPIPVGLERDVLLWKPKH